MTKEKLHELLLKYIRSSNYMTASDGCPEFLFPTWICSNRNRNYTINIASKRQGKNKKGEYFENSLLKMGESWYFEQFEKDATSLGIPICREIIFPIEDINLWQNCIIKAYKGILSEKELRQESKTLKANFFKTAIDEMDKNFISLDAYVKEKSIDFEVDGKHHEQRELLDKARDKYLEIKYGIKTFRYESYGGGMWKTRVVNRKERAKAKAKLKLDFESCNSRTEFIPDFAETGLEFYLQHENLEDSLRIFEELVEKDIIRNGYISLRNLSTSSKKLMKEDYISKGVQNLYKTIFEKKVTFIRD